MSKDMNQEVDNKNTTLESQTTDNVGLNVSGHILIKDKDTGEVLVDKRNAIHYGNMAYIVAQALNGFNTENAFIDRIAFGNGATITIASLRDCPDYTQPNHKNKDSFPSAFERCLTCSTSRK